MDKIITKNNRSVHFYDYKDEYGDKMWCVDPMWNDGIVDTYHFENKLDAYNKAEQLLNQ